MVYRNALDSCPTEDGTAHITLDSFLRTAYKEVSATFVRGPSSVLDAFVPKATTLLSLNLLNQARIFLF